MRQAQMYADTGDADSRGYEIEVVAVNDLADKANMEYLLRYDSVYRTRISADNKNTQIYADEGALVMGGKRIKYLSEKDPAKLPWKELGIDVVVEATGFFASVEKSQAHLLAGAKRVVITAPLREQSQIDADTDTQMHADKAETVLLGINEDKLKNCTISSNASCTTNAASPLIAILDEAIGVEKAVLNTVHAYTATQSLVDAPSGKKPARPNGRSGGGFREGRAAAVNIIPSSTGAALALAKAYPKLEGKFDGISLRVPVVCGSIADITFIAKRDTSAEEVNEILRNAAKEPRWQGIFSASNDELVSSDIVGASEGAIAELSMTRVVGGNLVKVLVWYDNEAGYANTLVKHVLEAGKHI